MGGCSLLRVAQDAVLGRHSCQISPEGTTENLPGRQSWVSLDRTPMRSALCHPEPTAKLGRSAVLPMAGPATGKANPTGRVELS